MNRKRLQRLYDIVDGHKDNGVKFNMGTWLQRNECGTTACAVGLYVLKSRQRDLRLMPASSIPVLSILGQSYITNGKQDSPARSLEKHFDLNAHDVWYLFFNVRASKQEFLARLKSVLERNGNE